MRPYRNISDSELQRLEAIHSIRGKISIILVAVKNFVTVTDNFIF